MTGKRVRQSIAKTVPFSGRDLHVHIRYYKYINEYKLVILAPAKADSLRSVYAVRRRPRAALRGDGSGRHVRQGAMTSFKFIATYDDILIADFMCLGRSHAERLQDLARLQVVHLART